MTYKMEINMLCEWGKCLSAMARWIKKITQLLIAANSNQMHFIGSGKNTRSRVPAIKQ
jgi:hypothetical protein